MVKVYDIDLAVVEKVPNTHYEGTCLSTDDKPTDWPDNSLMVELDTGDIYYCVNGAWAKVGEATEYEPDENEDM